MKRTTKALIVISLIAITYCRVYAQDEGDDNPKANVNLGMTIAAPLNPTARLVNLGWGITTGAGYNFTRRHAVMSEFMWNKLLPSDAALAPFRVALQNPNISGSSNLFAFTGNYRFELRGKTLGTYFIGGGGLYYRTAYFSQKVTSGTTTTCTAVWLWWGFTCTSGTVTSNQSIGSSSSSALGVNAGIGFTARVGEAPYRVYVESRYHYAPNKRVDTRILGISVGIRY
jgi:Outer membrane protein beta-barrel domain